MPTSVRYGSDSTLNLELPPDVLIAACDVPRATALDDPAAVVSEAIQSPLNFPPLELALVPGDQIVLAVDPAVPQPESVITPIIESMLDHGIEPRDIHVLQSSFAMADESSILASLPAAIRAEIQQVTHNPEDRSQLSYLAATTSGARPIYLHRLLCDADFVLPIGCLRPVQMLGYFGIGGGLYPTFSDLRTMRRYRSPRLMEDQPDIAAKARREAEEVAWLLGVQFTVQVIPAAGAGISHVLAGEIGAVFDHGRQLCESLWNYEVPRRASLVVAAIEGGATEQNWDNVGRALAAASRAALDDGAIAICCELDSELGPALQEIAGSDSLLAAYRRIRKQRAGDLLPATQLARALTRHKVYLLSRLDESVVEDLGIAAVAGPDEIARLAARHPSCIVLGNAQHAVAVPLNDVS